MSSAVAVRQEPRPTLEFVPSSARSEADDAAFLAAAYGLTPDDWQLRVLQGWLGLRDGGKWSAARAGLSVPRQNGKNALLEVRELYGIIGLGERFLHTAHEVKTARKAFLRLAGFFENKREWPELAGLARSIRKTNGQEAIELTNGGGVEFVARSRGSGRGYTVDVLVCDEAQELTDEQLEALLPTISSAPLGNPQMLLTGTPPPPGSAADVFVRMRESAFEGSDVRLAWHEWSVGRDVDVTDRALWYASNPALGVRLHEDVVEDELAALSHEGFMRERLGCWDASGSAAVIQPDVWAVLEDAESAPAEGRVVFAVDMPPNRQSTTIVVAGSRSDGLGHVEIVERGKGTAWAAQRAAELCKKWRTEVAVDPSSPAGSLIPQLEEAGATVVPVSGREMAQACGSFADMVSEGKLRHLGQPDMAAAVDAGRKRTLGDAWAWHRKDTSSDISPLVGATLALWVLSKPPKKKPRSGKAMFA